MRERAQRAHGAAAASPREPKRTQRAAPQRSRHPVHQTSASLSSPGGAASASGGGRRLAGSVSLTPETDEDMWELYNLIEDGAPWPLALTEGVVALVPKKATAGGPLDQRPVTLTNLGYRLWSGCRCSKAG